MEPDAEGCHCLTPPLDYRDFESEERGVDTADGRYAEVTVDRCLACGRSWVNYYYEQEAFSRSGRWYRGLVTAEQAAAVTASDALAVLASLPWYLYGGSYFDSAGRRSDVPLDPERA